MGRLDRGGGQVAPAAAAVAAWLSPLSPPEGNQAAQLSKHGGRGELPDRPHQI